MARASTQRKRRPRPPAQRSAQSAEDLMFFPKLRRRAKWVFLLLAIAFGGGFLIFGVGAGGSGIGDYVADLLNRPVSSEGPSLDDAREAAAERPNDPRARLDLARAAQREAQVDEAIAAYESYRALRPRDEDALRSLSALYGQKVAEAQRRAAVATNEAQEASLPQTFAPEDSPFLQELTGNAISERVSARAEARAQAANAEAQRLSNLQLDIYRDLTLLVDDEPLLFLQLAQASENAQDYESAVAAYEQFLELAPNNPNAEQIEQRVDALKTFIEQTGGGGTGDGSTGGSAGE
jgi:tetratricopeptide (TPR) repeat protein